MTTIEAFAAAAPRGHTWPTLPAWSRLASKRIRAAWAALCDIDGRAEREIIARYTGYSWCDSVERRLNDEIASYHCSRL